MSPDQVVRAWKDPDYTTRTGRDESESIPPHPVGPIEIADAALDVSGGKIAIRTEFVESLGCCQGFTQGGGYCDVTAGFPYCTMGCLTIVLSGASLC